jgi:hypothetical protein
MKRARAVGRKHQLVLKKNTATLFLVSSHFSHHGMEKARVKTTYLE